MSTNTNQRIRHNWKRKAQQLSLPLTLTLVIITTLVALFQNPREDPYEETRMFSRTWWQYPLEANAHRRLPFLEGYYGINNACIVEGTDTIWVVGSGLVARSDDLGTTWERIPLRPIPPPNDSPREMVQLEPSNSEAPDFAPSEEWPEDLHAVHFLDQNRGFISGQRFFVSTRDGGKSWKYEIPVEARHISFIDDKWGWIVDLTDNALYTTNDGGSTWTRNTTPEVRHAYFITANEGWALTDNDLLMTTNGGVTWNPLNADVGTFPQSFFFIDRAIGWIASDSDIERTTDGGHTWTTIMESDDFDDDFLIFDGIWFRDSRHGWLEYSDRHLARRTLSTDNGGASWRDSKRLPMPHHHDMELQQSGRAVAIQDYSRLYLTKDGGTTWSPLTQKSSPFLSLQAVGEQEAWSLSNYRLMRRTTTRDWQVIQNVSNVSGFFFLDQDRGWIIDSAGLKTTHDGGQSWTLINDSLSFDPPDFIRFSFQDADRGIAWSGGSDVLRTTDGGATWTQVNTTLAEAYQRFEEYKQESLAKGEGRIFPEGGVEDPRIAKIWNDSRLFYGDTRYYYGRGDLNAPWIYGYSKGFQVLAGNEDILSLPEEKQVSVLHAIDTTRTLAAGINGVLYLSENGGESWVPTATFDAKLYAIDFPFGGDIGWAVGDNGTIINTTDGGHSWSTQPSGVAEPLYQVDFSDERHGFVVGAGVTLYTRDGGQTWRDLTTHRIWPAPWYYLSLIIILSLAWGIHSWLEHNREVTTRSIADVLASDRPLEQSHLDRLGFDQVARSISRFLQNVATEPPLTLALTGPWGTGKSSLMKLLQADLDRGGLRTIWFNAWHHQKEQHLLAALLESIRQRTIPGLWTPAGVAFRLRLLRRRGRRYIPATLAVFATLVAVLGYLNAGDNFDQTIADLVRTAESIPKLLQSGAKIEGAESPGRLMTISTALIAILLALWRGAAGFGAKPAKLLDDIGGRFKIRNFTDQVGFRHQFAREFADVTAALGHRRLVLLIDDLDRCKNENILEMLEAVNFLVSCGPCLIVLGLDIDIIERNVSASFKEFVADLQAEEEEGEEGRARRQGELPIRRRYAKDYLEKLINIEIPVPRPNEEGFIKLMSNEDPFEGLPRWLLNLPKYIKAMTILVLALLLVKPIYNWGQGFYAPIPQTVPEAPAPRAQAVESAEDSRPREVTATSNAKGRNNIVHGWTWVVQSTPGTRSRSTVLVFLFALATILYVAARVWLQHRKERIDDSTEFRTALQRWSALLYLRGSTPRSVKRFLNRLRYIAMRGRQDQHDLTRWERILRRWLNLPSAPPANPSLQGEETALVAFSVLRETFPGLTKQPNFKEHIFAATGEFLSRREESIPEIKTKLVELLGTLSTKDLELFESERFQRLIEEVHVR